MEWHHHEIPKILYILHNHLNSSSVHAVYSLCIAAVFQWRIHTMITSSNGNIFRVTGPLWIHRSLVNSPHKGQRRGALMFSLICTWINGWVNNREAGDLRCHWAHYDVTAMQTQVAKGQLENYEISWYFHLFLVKCDKCKHIYSFSVCNELMRQLLNITKPSILHNNIADCMAAWTVRLN